MNLYATPVDTEPELITSIFKYIERDVKAAITKKFELDMMQTLVKFERYQEFYNYTAEFAEEFDEDAEISPKLPHAQPPIVIIAMFRTKYYKETDDKLQCSAPLLWGVTNKGTVVHATVTHSSDTVCNKYSFTWWTHCKCVPMFHERTCQKCWVEREEAKMPLHLITYNMVRSFDGDTMIDKATASDRTIMHNIIRSADRIPLQKNLLYDVEMRTQALDAKDEMLKKAALEIKERDDMHLARENELHEKEIAFAKYEQSQRTILKEKMTMVKDREAQLEHLNTLANIEELYAAFKRLTVEVLPYNWDPAVQQEMHNIESQLYKLSPTVVAKPAM